ncbi:MAG: mechanosensitive ion channel domain-containing protein [Fulvivirga sp.]
MEPYEIQIIKTLIVLLALALIKIILRKIINRVILRFNFQVERKTIISKTLDIFIVLFAIIGLTAIWSVNTQQILLFSTSVLTVIGIAFFAQWSILSNITSSLILFFNHPLRIGSYIKIVDKDNPIEGIVQNISFFFLYVKTENEEIITIPNSIVLQKIIALNIKR